MARHDHYSCGPLTGTVQVRLTTRSTGEYYVTAKLWRLATITRCPWHPEGGCGFCRHGTYQRVKPHGTLIARWYCRKAQRTLSALPDHLASHYSGTLAELEVHVRAVENAPSRAAAAQHQRTDIELPGALRYLCRLSRAVQSALRIIRGLDPQMFQQFEPTLSSFSAQLGTETTLATLRDHYARYLAQLPTPLGFNPSRTKPVTSLSRLQHRMGRDPPDAFVDSAR